MHIPAVLFAFDCVLWINVIKKNKKQHEYTY